MRAPRMPLVVYAAVVLGLAVGVGYAGWPAGARALELPGLMLGALVASTLRVRRSYTGDLGTMRPAFIAEFASLVLLGPPVAMFVAVAGEIAHELSHMPGRTRPGRLIGASGTALLAMQTAGAVHLALGGTTRSFDWPWQAVPMAASVAAFSIVRGAVAGLVAPLFEKRRLEPTWPARILRVFPAHLVGASIGVALAEAIVRGHWEVLSMAALPLYFAFGAYGDALDRSDEEHHRHEVIDALVQGMSVVNDEGAITLWSDALERVVGCPRERALGETLTAAVPALAKTDIPRAVDDVMRTRVPRMVANLMLPTATGSRVLDVRIVPVGSGVTLLWHDVTDRTREDVALKKSEARLALAAEAGDDGLWEWDVRTQECFFSGRWRALLGLAAEPGAGQADEWFGRVHPEDVGPFKEALKAHLAGVTDRLHHEHRLRHEDGTYRWFLCRGVAARSGGRRTGRIAGSLTERGDGIVRERLASAGYLDPLTGLANRSVFVERLGHRLADAKERRISDRFAVLYLDLDRFKVVNDSLGHLIGDELLTAVSRRLEACLRPTDVLARLGGDEFAILLSSLGDEQQANAVAFRIQESLSAPFSIGGREVFTTASIGIALGLTDYDSPDEIMRDADTAMYHAKTRGKARHELFDADMHARVRDRLGLENDLRHAVANNAFEVHYQPIVALGSGMCVGFESLIRWKRNGQPVPPDKFIPLAEELGLIEPLGTWVLRQACRTFADWQRQYGGALDYITVNVSSRQLVHQNFLTVVERAVHDAGLKPGELRLEITETALMDSPKTAASILRELRDFGVMVYLDDFGTGYSSLSHLHRLPVDALKIDRSFVNSLLLPDRPAIVESILALARTLNTRVVAEGIETAEQSEELERLGCTHAQGYLFSRPLPTEAAEELLARNHPLGPKKALVPAVVTGDAPTAPELYARSGPFTWPAFIPVRDEAADEPPPSLAQA